MANAATNPAYYDGYPQGWSVQSVLTAGGGDESLVSGGSAPTTGLASGGPARNSLLAWTFDPIMSVTGTVIPATGKQFASKFYWPGGYMSYLWVYCTSHPTAQTHGWLAVYDGTGALWANTADFGVTALTTSPAANKVALAVSTPVPSGYYYGYGVFVWTSGSGPILNGWSTTGINAAKDTGNSAGSWDFAYDTTDTVTTTLPASLTWGSGNWATDSLYMPWFGVS